MARKKKLTYIQQAVSEDRIEDLLQELQNALVVHAPRTPRTRQNPNLINWVECKLIANREEEERLREVMG